MHVAAALRMAKCTTDPKASKCMRFVGLSNTLAKAAQLGTDACVSVRYCLRLSGVCFLRLTVTELHSLERKYVYAWLVYCNVLYCTALPVP